jgi:hypothetical protein
MLFNQYGSFYGTPKESGDFSFTVSVTDSSIRYKRGPVNVKLTINPGETVVVPGGGEQRVERAAGRW